MIFQIPVVTGNVSSGEATTTVRLGEREALQFVFRQKCAVKYVVLIVTVFGTHVS